MHVDRRVVKAFLAALVLAAPAAAAPVRIAVRVPAAPAKAALDGRLLLLISKDATAEPRTQISESPATQQVFGRDVEGFSAAAPAVFDGSELGYPLEALADLPAGAYTVQALLDIYETHHRADGHTVKLPVDRGEGRQWNQAPGNLYSTPRQATLDPARGITLELVLDQVIPPIAPAAETKYVKHERIRSERLSRFWGRDVFLGAHVLLPLSLIHI